MKQQKAVFLDRDGTIIIDKVYLNDPEEIVYLPNSIEGLKYFGSLGFQLIVVTNQSGIARGIVQEENLHEIHRRIKTYYAKHGILFAGFYHAPYAVESNHYLRKPNPGMLLEGARDHRIELSQSWMIGDRLTDVEAGRRAGTQTVFIGSPEKDPDRASIGNPDIIVTDLLDAARMIEKWSK